MIKFILIFLFVSYSLFANSKEEVKKQIDSIISKLPASTKCAIMVYNPLNQDTIFSFNHLQPMIPASNTKLFTTATALSVIGGDHMLSVKIYSDDKNISDGVVNGNLYVKGFGYSTFTEYDLQLIANQVANNKINKITGKIIGDDSYFDDVYFRDDWIDEETANVKLPPVSALVIDRNQIVTTRKKGRRLRRYVVNIDNPPLYTAELLTKKLRDAGIFISESPQSGITPNECLLIAETGIPLRDLIQHINKNSDNFLAECLFKTIGAEASKKEGNAFYSTQAILNFINDNDIYSKGTSIVDGSGISRFDQVTAASLTGLLEVMYFDIANFDDFYNSLSIAGVDGTLRNRMNDPYSKFSFRGKTGTLNGVSSLSGYLTTSNGDDLIVTIIFEFEKGSRKDYKKIEDEIVTLLSELE